MRVLCVADKEASVAGARRVSKVGDKVEVVPRNQITKSFTQLPLMLTSCIIVL